MKEEHQDIYSACTLCPRSCGVNRMLSKGWCACLSEPRVAWTGLHKGEEAPVSGENGSGMFFFVGCTLGCSICQNIDISTRSSYEELGEAFTPLALAEKMLILQGEGAETISFVTGEHFAVSIVEAIILARRSGLSIPTVFNTSGFMAKETIDLLLPVIDIWLWDTKTLSSSLAREYFGSESYPEVEDKALRYLLSKLGEEDLALEEGRGVIVRHLVLPGHIKESIEVIEHFARNYKDKCYFSLMYQFIPPENACDELKKRLTPADVEVLEDALFLGEIEKGFVQELDENEEVWRPNFRRSNPFPENFARTV